GVARSRSLQGPWHKHPDNPILAGTEEWRCPGHGTIVEAADGRTFLLYHGFTARDFLKLGRYGLLDEVMWPMDGWPAINSAQGPSVLSEGLEIEVADAAPPANDDFSDSVLSPVWQWPIGQRPQVQVGASTAGWLELKVPSGATRDEAILAQRAPPGRYAVSTLVDIAQLHEGESAGLGAYANAQQLVALTAADGALTLWSRENGRELVLARVAIGGAKQVSLRMIRTSEAGYRFAYKIAAEKWHTVVTLSGTDAVHKPASNPTRIVVLSRGPAGATGRFDYVRLERW
ncbi:MAG TPA: family 43 glycosylhydrolase, partial [Burkholderiales bacterium]|nr:family 43 glycosylhydrolase [Burkholderiales bacterium]